MKGVIVAGYARSLINFRGPLIRELVALGVDIVACAPEDDKDTAFELEALGVRYIPVPMNRAGLNPFHDVTYVKSLVSLLKEERPDFVLSYTAKPVIYASFAARLAGVPNIHAMITGLGYAFMGESVARRLVKQVASLMYAGSLRFCKSVIFQNPDDLSLFVHSKLVRPDRSFLVSGSGVDLEQYTFSPIPNNLNFLLVSRLIREKGLFEYVQAARYLRRLYPSATFSLLGPTDSNPASISLNEVHSWEREGIIQYYGETRDVRPFLRDAAVFVLPSYYREGIPRTILEAMATGRAVVTTDWPGCRETVVHGENGFLVPPRDWEALAAALETFILNPQLTTNMGTKSRTLAEERFDVNKVNGDILTSLGLVT